jgi:hypothetical protein
VLNTVTILPDSITGDFATITATLAFLGVTYTSSVSVSKVYNQLVSRIQRPIDLITSANDGTGYTLPSASNYLELYNGIAKITSGITYGPATTTKNGLTVAVNSTTGQITVSQANINSWTTDSENFTLTAIKDTVSYNSTYTITKAKAGNNGTNGTNAINAGLTNSAYTVTADNTGYVISYSSAGGNFKVYSGTDDITTGNGIVYSKFYSSDGLDIAINATTGVYTVTGLSVDTGLATLRATLPAAYGGINIDRIYSIAKSRAGQQGNSITGATGPAGSATFIVTRTANNSDAPSTGTTSSEIYIAIQRTTPVQGDVAVISYNNAQNSIAYRYTGSIWATQAAWITGDLIVSGGITADKIKAGTITSADGNFNLTIGGAVSQALPETFTTTNGINIHRRNDNNTAVNTFNLSNGAIYEIVDLGNTTWPGYSIFGTTKWFVYNSGNFTGNGTGTVKKVPGFGIMINDTTRYTGITGGFSNFQPGFYSYSKYGSTAKFYSDAALNGIQGVNVVSIQGSGDVGLDILSMASRFGTAGLRVTNLGYPAAIFEGGGVNTTVTITSTNTSGPGVGIGLAVTAGSLAYPSVDITNSGGNSAVAINAVGLIRATGNVIAYYSDDRLKTKLGLISNALEKLNTLSGFYYEPNETAQSLGYEKRREVGVSAQEVLKILPEIIHKAPIDDKYLTVDYERLIPLIIEAIKELDRRTK